MVVLSLALALALAAPLAAQAGPLLSGYGGPGQGNQAILGSTLIGGPGGGSGGPGGGETATSASGGAASAAQPVAGATQTSASRASSGRGGHGVSGAGTATTRSARPVVGELSDRSYPGLESAGGGSALGLSAAEIVYIVLAAAALAFTGLLTRRLAGTRAAKGHS